MDEWVCHGFLLALWLYICVGGVHAAKSMRGIPWSVDRQLACLHIGCCSCSGNSTAPISDEIVARQVGATQAAAHESIVAGVYYFRNEAKSKWFPYCAVCSRLCSFSFVRF
jgi:hypothetical protein